MSKAKIENENFFVLRTPRMPVNYLQALGAERSKNRDVINKWLEMPNVVEALYLASPSLINSIDQWQKKPDSKQGKKTEQSLLKYMIRMCSRPTPFGLFSGIHLGEIGDVETSFVSDSYLNDARKTRLDMFYLSGMKQHVQQSDVRSEQLVYYPNTSHYFIAQQCRYIETYQSKKTRQYRLSEIEADEYFLFLLDSARSGKSFNQLTNAFVEQYQEAELEDVESYVEELITASILVADVPIALTGRSPDSVLVDSLSKIGQSDFADALETALYHLNKIDEDGTASVERYKSIYQELKKLAVDVDEGKLFQVDTYRHYHSCQLSQAQVSQLSRQLMLLKELGSSSSDSFRDFLKKFNERYEGQFVRLDKLLDDESGISFSNETGYESRLLAGLNLSSGNSGRPLAPLVSKLDRAVVKAISAPENSGADVIQLKSKELKKEIGKDSKLKTLPTSYGAIVSLYQDQDGKPLVNLSGCFGPSAANLLGRFCHLNEELVESVKAHLEKEERHSPEVIFAEIAHIPEGRPGNVIARPHLRKYEIVFMADSELDSEYQIPVSDLYVWTEEGQVKLWSKRLQKQIVPRLSSAHNFSSRSLSIYKFLSMTQMQTQTAPSFSMPTSLSQSTFVPRVMLDNLILSLKKWRVKREEIEKLVKEKEINLTELESFKSKYNLDDIVSYSEGDNVLQLNLNSPQLIEILLAETRGMPIIELQEVLTSQYRTPIKGEDDEYFSNELIIPFFNENAKQFKTLKVDPQKSVEAKPIKRRFTPGSEWLSLKIYSGNSCVDNILSEHLLPLIESNKTLYEKWFFIRYGDPDWHLRLRFNGDPKSLFSELLPLLMQNLDTMVESGAVHKVEVFTYEREVERYGGAESMDAVEGLFCADSNLVAKAVQLESLEDEDIRWRVALLATDKLLTMFRFSEQDKLKLLSSLRDGFGREFNETSMLRKQLGNRFREVESTLKSDFTSYLEKENEELTELQKSIFTLIDSWSVEAEPYINEILAKYDSKQALSCPKDDLLGSIIHMHNNRMFKAYGRQLELVMHDFLRRLYFSKSKGH